VKSSSQHQLPQQLVFANQDDAIQQILEVLSEQAVATWVHKAQAKDTANPQWDVYAYLASHIIYSLNVQFLEDGQEREGGVWRAFSRPKLYEELKKLVCKAPEKVNSLKEAVQALTLRFRWKRGGAGWHSEFNLQVGKLLGQYQTEKELTPTEKPRHPNLDEEAQ
jgi:hypothetical protein